MNQSMNRNSRNSRNSRIDAFVNELERFGISKDIATAIAFATLHQSAAKSNLLRNVCKSLGIHYTYKAMSEWLAEDRPCTIEDISSFVQLYSDLSFHIEVENGLYYPMACGFEWIPGIRQRTELGAWIKILYRVEAGCWSILHSHEKGKYLRGVK
jgi:hypothetical protein